MFVYVCVYVYNFIYYMSNSLNKSIFRKKCNKLHKNKCIEINQINHINVNICSHIS